MSFHDQRQTDLVNTALLPKPDGFADPVTVTKKDGSPPIPTHALLEYSEDMLEDGRGNQKVLLALFDFSVVGLLVKGDVVDITGNNTAFEVVRIVGRDAVSVRVLCRGDLAGSYT